MLALAGSAGAEPSVATPAQAALAWSTYLRTGPSNAARVIDELEHDQVVTVGACTARWCRISVGDSVGYVDRDSLALPRTPLPSPGVGVRDCFTAPLEGYRTKSVSRFCPKASGG